jgi:hypothetical protein
MWRNKDILRRFGRCSGGNITTTFRLTDGAEIFREAVADKYAAAVHQKT